MRVVGLLALAGLAAAAPGWAPDTSIVPERPAPTATAPTEVPAATAATTAAIVADGAAASPQTSLATAIVPAPAAALAASVATASGEEAGARLLTPEAATAGAAPAADKVDAIAAAASPRRHNKGELMWFAWRELLTSGHLSPTAKTQLLDADAKTQLLDAGGNSRRLAHGGRSALIWTAFKEYMDTGTVQAFNKQAANLTVT